MIAANRSLKRATLLSYGVTNSGKTYTTLGAEDEPGLLPRLIEHLFKRYPDKEITMTAFGMY